VELLVADQLAKEIRIVNRPTANVSHIQSLIDANKVKPYTATSLIDEQGLRQAMQGADIIIHSAALARCLIIHSVNVCVCAKFRLRQ